MVPEDFPETIDELEEGALVADVLEEVAAEDEGGLLELELPFGTGATTPPCTVPLADVEVPAALDL